MSEWLVSYSNRIGRKSAQFHCAVDGAKINIREIASKSGKRDKKTRKEK
jgi:hypothetical protein